MMEPSSGASTLEEDNHNSYNINNNTMTTMVEEATTINIIENDDETSSIQHNVVTWADGVSHSKGGLSSTISTSPSSVSNTNTASTMNDNSIPSTHENELHPHNINSSNNSNKPLRALNFAEEGSSTAAVMDANITMSSTSSSTSDSALPTTTASSSSTPATVSPLSSPAAATLPPQVRDPSSLLTSSDNNNNNNNNNNTINNINMGTNVDIAPPLEAKLVSVAILQEPEAPVVAAEVEEEEETTAAVNRAPVTPLSECWSKDDQDDNDTIEDNHDDDDDDEDYTAAVTLSPAWSESTHDPRAYNLSPNSSSDSSDEDNDDNVVMMTPSKSDMEHGIILPPSLSGASSTSVATPTTTSPRVVSPSPSIMTTSSRTSSPLAVMMSPSFRRETESLGVYNNCGTTTAAADVHVPTVCQLVSLPMDSLHCIASFLTPVEWSQYGQTCTAASKVCRDIFRRVRMHGFRCATEVITAWKLEQLADAKELAALYISTGVPIYPYSLGHSYHTMVWRMGIEAKDMQAKLNADADNGNNEEGEPAPANANPVDRFYDERSVRARDADNPLCSYLEDKSMFMLGPNHLANATNPMSAGRWGSMTSLHANHHQREQPLVPPAVVAIADLAQPATRVPGFQRSLSLASSTPIRSMSQSERIAKSKAPKVVVPVHRHLLDQHLLGRSCVDDEAGELKTPPVSLSADFFHPHLLSHSMSATHSRPLMQQPAPTRVSAPASGAPVPDEDLLEDPAFQAWATRAASTVHNRLNGAALDSEELAELQELYSQIFAADRNATAPAAAPGDAGNPLQGPAAVEQRFVVAPQQQPVVPQDPAAAASLESSLLSTVLPRDGYNSILNSVDLDVYSASTANTKDKPERSDLIRQLRARFTFYQRRLEVLLLHGDSVGHEECMLDLWDEFFPLTAQIHYYDRHTAVPRISSLQQFLTQPCPKELGIVQCEIERVRISSKKKKGVSMTGRLFPTYEYRLFIKDRDHGKSNTTPDDNIEEEEEEEVNGIRRDTVLMVAKNRGRKHVDTSGVVSLTPAAKKGANNYYLYTPQQDDVDTHFNEVNGTEEKATGNANGASLSAPASKSTSSSQMLLGRLQSNFIGTEFQIYTPKLRKSLPGKPIRRSASMYEAASSFDEDPEYESGFTSDTGSTGRRRSRFGRLSLRRSSSHVSSRSNGEFISPSRSRSRSRSKQESSKAPRTNRRAIANSTEAMPEGENESSLNQQPFLCEEEDGVITYTANLLGSRPRIMDVCVPKLPQEESAGSVWTKFLESTEDTEDVAPYNRMLSRFKELQQRLESQTEDDNEEVQDEENEGAPADFGLLALQNRPPWWNIELGSFVLNFRGRVSVASVKNFQLCDRNDHDHIMLQFGRIQGRHSFTMDYQYPLTAVQAFSIAISSLQSKISFG